MSHQPVADASVPLDPQPAASRRERVRGRAGALVGTGLAIQIATLFWPHPLSFLAFALLGGSLIFVGAIHYLGWDLLAPQLDSDKDDSGAATPRSG